MEKSPKLLDGWLLYLTNHLTHPVLEAQGASPRHHLARKLSERGQRLLVYSPLGRHVGNPLTDFIANLRPRRVVRGQTVYLSPPVLVSPASPTTVITLVMGTLFALAYLTLSRTKISATYSTTVLVGTVGAVLRRTKGVPFVANYGDPDFARERGLARRAFEFCESLVLAPGTAYCVIYVDEVIGRYIRGRFRVKNAVFLPNGGYEKGAAPTSPDDPAVTMARKGLGIEGKQAVLYAGQVSKGYRIDLLIPAAERLKQSMPNVVFIVIGGGNALTDLVKQAKERGLRTDMLFLGQVPYSKMGPYLALSSVGLQLLNDMCMGTKVLMYMANQVPVISVGGWYDKYGDFLKNGENIVLGPPDADSLANGLEDLLSDSSKREQLATAGWQAVRPYTWDRHADETLRLLGEAADLTRRTR